MYALTGTDLETAAISTLYPVPNGGQVIRFFERSDGDDDLYLLTLEEGTLYFTQLDPQNGQPLVHLPLFPWTSDQSIRSMIWEENYLVLFTDSGPFAVLVPDGLGGWKVDLTGDLSGQYALNCYPSPDQYTGKERHSTISLLYDGDRLIFADPYVRAGGKDADLFLSVYDKDGLAYLGAYCSTLPKEASALYSSMLPSPSHLLSWAQTSS